MKDGIANLVQHTRYMPAPSLEALTGMVHAYYISKSAEKTLWPRSCTLAGMLFGIL